MESLIVLLKMIAMLLAGVAVGNWFLSKVKENRARALPFHRAFLTPPGLIILVAVFVLPLLVWWLE